MNTPAPAGRPVEGKVDEALHMFDYGHMPEGSPRKVCIAFASAALQLAECELPEDDLIDGLMKLRGVNDFFLKSADRETGRQRNDTAS